MLIEKWWDEAREKVCGWAEDIKDGYEVNMTEVRELVDEMEREAERLANKIDVKLCRIPEGMLTEREAEMWENLLDNLDEAVETAYDIKIILGGEWVEKKERLIRLLKDLANIPVRVPDVIL